MPRLILVTDDLEARTREAVSSSPDYFPGIIKEYLDLLDASHASQRARAERFAANYPGDTAAVPTVDNHPDERARCTGIFGGHVCAYHGRVDV